MYSRSFQASVAISSVFGLSLLLSFSWSFRLRNPCPVVLRRSTVALHSIVGQNGPTTPPLDKTVHGVLCGMTCFFSDMVDTDSVESNGSNTTHRFFYTCFPQKGERQHHFMPIRDLAAAWDATKILLYWRQYTKDGVCGTDAVVKNHLQRLERVVLDTIRFYGKSFARLKKGNDSNCMSLDPSILKETATIAHSALFLLAAVGAMRLKLTEFHPENESIASSINGLVAGILFSQRSDGAFQPRFEYHGNDAMENIEFAPGQAMVALMEVYALDHEISVLEASTRQSILPAMERAVEFYSDLYYHKDMDVNYNIWQIQAFARLFLCVSRESSVAREILPNIISDMSRDIVGSKSWKYQLSRGSSFYPNLNTIEIACGLDAIVDGARVVQAIQDDDFDSLLHLNIRNAIYFLEWAQDRLNNDVLIGRGGLGFGGVQIFEQRLDVTGHAISGLTKMNDIDGIVYSR
jgi:hypothetical protein